MRPYPGKTAGVVYDVADHVRYFYEHSQRRRKIYSTEPGWKIKDVYVKFRHEGWMP